MNLLAFSGYGFYGAASTLERAALYSSYGLVSIAANYVAHTFILGHYLRLLRGICTKRIKCRR